jgi:hypothetical protein
MRGQGEGKEGKKERRKEGKRKTGKEGKRI